MQRIVTVSEEDLKEMITKVVRNEVRLVPRKRKKPYTGVEVDNLFDISSPTRHAWAKKGYIEKVSIGGRMYYTSESVEQYFQKKIEDSLGGF